MTNSHDDMDTAASSTLSTSLEINNKSTSTANALILNDIDGTRCRQQRQHTQAVTETQPIIHVDALCK